MGVEGEYKPPQSLDWGVGIHVANLGFWLCNGLKTPYRRILKMPMLSMYAPHMNREEFSSELKRIASMLREGYTSGQKSQSEKL